MVDPSERLYLARRYMLFHLGVFYRMANNMKSVTMCGKVTWDFGPATSKDKIVFSRSTVETAILVKTLALEGHHSIMMDP